MPTLPQLALGLLQALVLLAAAPLLSGFGRMIRATMHSRQGPGVLQNYRDIFKLMKRQELSPDGAGLVFRATPFIMLATLMLVAMALPVVTHTSPLGATGDVIAVIYLLALARFFFSLAGIDSGNTFAGLGASRELTMGVLIEPVILLSLLVAALLAGSTSLGAISAAFGTGSIAAMAAGATAAIAFAFAMFVEMGKVPYDMAEAEQELQEGPLAEYSGPSLALMKLAISLKQVIMASLLIGLFVPFGAAATPAPMAIAGAILAFVVKLALVFLVAGVIENSVARGRFMLASRSTWVGFGIATLAFAFYLVGL
jgi:hydrogenase-4 component C